MKTNKPKCQICNKKKDVIKVYYDLGDVRDYYWECNNCYCVVKRISRFKLN